MKRQRLQLQVDLNQSYFEKVGLVVLYSLISKQDQEEGLDCIVLVYVKAVVLLNSSLCVKWDCKMCLAV